MDRFRTLQDARLPVGAEVDLTALAAIADAHAAEVWGDDVARGEPFPVTDAAGAVRAYVFPFARGVRAFPADAGRGDARSASDGSFGGIYVSATPTADPVLRVVHSLHPLFTRGDEAESIGRSALETGDARLTRIYWLGLHRELFEVSGAGRRTLLDVRTLRPVEADTVSRPSAIGSEHAEVPVAERPPVEQLKAMRADGLQVGPTVKLVPHPECVPVVDWTYWCVPTAWTMAVCYHDNYVKNVGGTLGYGRLVGHWFDHLASGHNVPDYIDQTIDPNSGPPPTWRSGFADFSDFIARTYGYAFSTRDVVANAANDWAWADITAEIDAGRPFVWGVPDHATCALGYRVCADGSRRVVINTTWGATEQQQREEWLHTQGTGLTAITPGGGTDGHDLALWSPDGGEQVLSNVTTEIRWHVWGDRITTAEVSVSADGGNSWTVVRQSAPCTPGWNVCDWTPTMVTDRARVRVRGLDANGAYIAGDGSHHDLRVLAGPRPVTLTTILVRSQTDDAGCFAAPHGFERYTPDGYAIRGITVAVQHTNGNWHTIEMSNSADNRFWWNDEVVAGMIASPSFAGRPVQVIVFAEHVVG